MDYLTFQRKKVIGYTTGVFDLFHIGHLNLLKKAKEQCDYLIVGVTVDELVAYKNTLAVIPYAERFEIVNAVRYVDEVVAQSTMDKRAAWDKLQFNRMFVGSDWENTSKWNKIEEDFKPVGVEVVYFPYTLGTSSTKLKQTLQTMIQ